MYISSSNSEKYFDDVKKSVMDLNFYNTDAFEGVMKRNNALTRYDAIINSNSISEYKNHIQGSNRSAPMDIPKCIPKDINEYYLEMINNLKNDVVPLDIFANNLKRFIVGENSDLNVGEIFSDNILNFPHENIISENNDYFNNNAYKINVLADKNRYLSNQNIQLKNNGKNFSIQKLLKR